MAIKWSPLAVSEAMDRVEAQVGLAESFLQEAHRIAKESLEIPNLPEYMGQYIRNLSDITGGAVGSMREVINKTRSHLSERELAKDKARAKMGSQPSLLDD